MIFINDNKKNDSCGSGRFTFELMNAIRPIFAKHFDDEQMQDFDNDLAFQKMLWFVDLPKDDFNFVVNAIQGIKMPSKWQSEQEVLIEFLKADPRYIA